MIPVAERGFMKFDRLDDVVQYAKVIADSSFCPDAFREKDKQGNLGPGKSGDIVVAIQFGLELGLTPMQALQNIAVINRRPTLFGDAMLAVCKAGADYESVEEWIEGEGDQMEAHCKAKRRGEPAHEVVFSVSDAHKAKLWRKFGPWTTHPKRMLQMKARSFCLRDVFPHLLRGMVAFEEAQDYEDLNKNFQKLPSDAVKTQMNPPGPEVKRKDSSLPPEEVYEVYIEDDLPDWELIKPRDSLIALSEKIPSEALQEALKRLSLTKIEDIPEEKVAIVLDYWLGKYGDKK